MQRVLIVGLGLIGGSIGLALRRWSEEHKATAASRWKSWASIRTSITSGLPKKLGAVDRGAWDLAKAAREADVVVVATPVSCHARRLPGPRAATAGLASIVTDTALDEG